MQLFTSLVVLHAVKSKVATIKILNSKVNDFNFSVQFFLLKIPFYFTDFSLKCYYRFFIRLPAINLNMQKLGNYVTGNWIEGDGDGAELYNAVSGKIITNTTSKGLNFKSVLKYAR